MVGNKELPIHADLDQALALMEELVCLSLSDTESISYMEELIEMIISSQLWDGCRCTLFSLFGGNSK
jgi:hypothetical protein